MGKKCSVFFSYNSQDKDIVEKIALRLTYNTKLSVWLDKWNLIPGDPWQEEIEKALDEAQCCVIFWGSSGMGPWQNMEMRTVLNARVSENSIRVVPVLLPGAVRQKESKLPRFLRELIWVIFREKWDEPEALHRLVCGIEGKMPGRYGGEIQEGICPFRGLEIFREQDRQFFFGREALMQRLLDKIVNNRFLAVTGSSGCGKSSLVQAGLISTLRRHSQVVLFTPRERPLEELAFALHISYPENNKPTVEQLRKRLREGGDILHLIAREILEYGEKKNLLIIVDQFEELFAQTRKEDERRQFISLILDAVDVSNGPVTVIMTIRSDFIGKCASYKNLNMFVNDYFVQVEPMRIEELRQAIEEPARMVGFSFEKGLVNQILDDIKGAPGELPLLEHALLELYERHDGGRFTLQAYNAIGGITGALVNRSESEFNELDETEKEILRKMFVLRLIQPGEGTEDTRRRVAKEELLAIDGDVEIIERVLNKWIEARLLTSTRDTNRGQVLIDVAHEALIRKWDRIQTWMPNGREAARLIGILRQTVLEWKKANHSPDYLFQGVRLVQMENLVNIYEVDLTKDEIEFVKAGIALHRKREKEKEKRRSRRTTIIWSFIFIVFIALITMLYMKVDFYMREESFDRKKLVGKYWEKGREAKEGGNFLYSVHLYAEAIDLNEESVTKKSLLLDVNNCLNSNSLINTFQHKKTVIGARFNKNEKRILTWSLDNTACLWDATTGNQIIPELQHKDWVLGAIFNFDESRILTWCMDNTVRLWDTDSGRQIGQAMEHEGKVNGAIFNYNGTRILTWSNDGKARIWTKKKDNQKLDLKHAGEVFGARFNKNGSCVLTWSEDGTARTWDTNIGKQKLYLVHEGPVLGAIFDKDETIILTWSEDKSARLWSAVTGRQIGLKMRHNERVNGAKFNSNETMIITWGDDNIVRRWDKNTGKQIGPNLQHQDWVNGAMLNSDEKKILTWSQAGNARLWDIDTGQQIGKNMNFTQSVMRFFYDRKGDLFFRVNHKTLFIMDFNSKKKKLTLEHKGFINEARFNVAETLILTWAYNDTILLWDVKTGKQVGTVLIGHKYDVLGAILNVDKTKLLTWGTDGTARIWNIKTDISNQIGLTLKHQETVLGATLNSNGSKALTWSSDNTIRIWDTSTGKELNSTREYKEWINRWREKKKNQEYEVVKGGKFIPDSQKKDLILGSRFNNDEAWLLAWDNNNTVSIWDINTWKKIGIVLRHGGSVLGASFNLDETKIISWSSDRTAKILDIAVDLDYPNYMFKLQVWALTGTRLNTSKMEIEIIEPDEWRKIKREYMEFAKEHLKVCKYPHGNVFRKLFPDEAKKTL